MDYYKITKLHEKFYLTRGISALKPNLCILICLLDVDFEKYLLNYPNRISGIKWPLGPKKLFKLLA